MKNQRIREEIEFVLTDSDLQRDFLIFDKEENHEVSLQTSYSDENGLHLFWNDGSKTTVTIATEEDDREGEWVEIEDELIFLTD